MNQKYTDFDSDINLVHIHCYQYIGHLINESINCDSTFYTSFYLHHNIFPQQQVTGSWATVLLGFETNINLDVRVETNINLDVRVETSINLDVRVEININLDVRVD